MTKVVKKAKPTTAGKPRRKPATKKAGKKPKKKKATSTAIHLTAADREKGFKGQAGRKWKRLMGCIPGYDPIGTSGDCHFEMKAADHAANFFPTCLVHVKGPKGGQPFVLEDWEKAIVGCLFGWRRPDGTRRYRAALIYVARKNGKSTLSAGIMLYILYFDKEPGAELYSAASKRDQAALIHGIAAKMVRLNTAMKDQATIYKSFKSIELKNETGTYKAISADANTEIGSNPHAAAIDELQAMPTPDLVYMLETGVAARKQPLLIHTTTADWARPSICNEKRDYAGKVRDGIIDDPSFLPAIFEVPMDLDWTKEKNWKLANPNLGVTFTMESLREDYKKAREIPRFENHFRRMRLNQVTEQAERWLSIEEWDECAGERSPAELAEAMVGKECWGGLDLASKVDIAALVLMFKEGEKFVALPFCWVPKDSAEIREKRQGVPYLTWSRQGLLKATPGNVIDFDVIRDDILELMKKYRIVDIGADPYNAGDFLTKLHEQDGLEVVEFRQGIVSMNDPTKNLGMLVKAGRLIHGGHAVMKWSAANVVVETDAAGNLKPTKKKSTEKIDPIVALIMAVGRAMGGETGESVYEQRGVLTV